LFERWRLFERLSDRPALVDVDSEYMIADQPPQLLEIAAVALGAEPDLQFEGAMAAAYRCFRHSDASVRVDAAGVGAHPPRTATEHPPQRRPGTAGE
jgi:hypothetical protein